MVQSRFGDRRAEGCAIGHRAAASERRRPLPEVPFPKEMPLEDSLRQATVGVGDPEAAHRSVTSFPSRTTMSVLVG